MSQTVIPVGASLLARRLCDIARVCAIEHAAALASVCAFALLGAPVTGVVVAALIATSRARAALEIALCRLRTAEDELAQLRRTASAAQAHAVNMQLEAQRRSAAAAVDHERECSRVAELVRRIVCDPARAIVEMLNAVGAQGVQRPVQLIGAPVGHLIRSALATFAQNVHDVFDPSPADRCAIVLEESPVDLRCVIDGAVALLAPRAIAKGLQLRVCTDRSVAAWVLADRERIGQIVFNLLDAAISATRVGRLTVAANTETLNAGSQRVFIGVSGARPGTPYDRVVVVDDQASNHIGTPDVPDLGLCRLLAQRMGGDIEIGNSSAFGVCMAFHAPFTVERFARPPSSGDGRRRAVVELSACHERRALCDLLDKLGVDVVPAGMPVPGHVDLWFADEHAPVPGLSRVTRIVLVTESFIPGGLSEMDGHLTLSVNPLSWSAVERVCMLRGINRRVRAQRVPACDTQAPASTVAQRAVLIVDDNEINRKVVARQLDVLGYRCVAVPGAEAAVAAMARQSFDVLITDLHMPGANGIELAKRVRAMNRLASPKMPVVLMTGETDIGDRVEVPPTLFDSVLPKPTSLDALNACLQALFVEPLLNARNLGTEQEERLDRRHLDALSEHGIDVAEVLSGWQQAMEEDLMQLHACREQRDADGLRALLHRLSGAVGLVGAAGLMDALRQSGAMRPEPPAVLLDSLVSRIRVLIAQLRRGNQASDQAEAEQAMPMSGAVAVER
ncbi:hybrid sensor histidine kinase/response regulator [Paraburkholderia humisilvae]|uniref:hybrid sensor histidine kinase/response regulator n=1 Tax=Paraburkholderia humisilvae TaxID=627669 RepID=UPI0036141913